VRRRTLLKTAAAAAVGTFSHIRPLTAEPLRFPPEFLWGTATSSYQVEGRGDRTADSIWDTFARLEGAIRDGSNGDVACDHYHRYPEDIALIAHAGLKAYRFSISWPRVLPDGIGQADERGLDFYSRLTDALLASGIEPWVCLFHWDLPQTLQDRGGWVNRQIADWYAEYAGLMARRLGDRVTRWVTFNEPSVHAILGHGLGEHAPGLRGAATTFAALHHQNLAQGRGIAALRSIGGKRFQVGTALPLQPCRPGGTKSADRAAAEMWDAIWNRTCLDPVVHGDYPALVAAAMEPLIKSNDLLQIHQPLDFLGLNYYNPMYLRDAPGHLFGCHWAAPPAGTQMTALGWPIDAGGLLVILSELRDRYGNLPIYVTENGACFSETPAASGRIEDDRRIAFLYDHIAVCHAAITAKVNLRGYFVWTLIDNFEWAQGYTAPFGIVNINRADLKRTPKVSFDWIQRVAQSNTL
jgi:beta-glucosidase